MCIQKRSSKFSGFTLVELMVVMGVVGVLMGLMIPGLNYARKFASSAQCVQNLRGMGAAIQLYTAENDDRLPYALNGVTVYVQPDTDYLGSKIAPYMGYTLIPHQYMFIKELICPGASKALAEAKKANFISYMVKDIYVPGVGTLFAFSSGETYGGGAPKSGMKMSFLAGSSGMKNVVKLANGTTFDYVGGLSRVIAFHDYDTAYARSASYTVIETMAHTKRNYLFFDWHVEAF